MYREANMEDRVARAIAEVRKTNATNMFDRAVVIEIMDMLGYEEEANYLKEDLSRYGNLLRKSGEY